MICRKCGIQNSIDAKYCLSCGEPLETETTQSIPLERDKITPGQLIINKRFKVLRQIGRGGMGEIFLAEDVKLKRKVAVKSILKNALNDRASKTRFLREAQTASQLDHPNICTIYEIYDEAERDYIVMQYIDGVTLDHIIDLGHLSISKVIDIAAQLCDGMIEANSKHIIHRDIKPSNIMVDKKGVVKILDFGLAKFRDKSIVKENGMVDSNLTEQGIVLGTVSYISPEQARGQTLDQGTDIFSTGIVLYEMLEGKNPFVDEEQITTLFNVIHNEVEFNGKDLPEELKKIVLQCLEKDKTKRYNDFVQLKTDLLHLRAGLAQAKLGIPADGRTEKIVHEEQEKLLLEIQKSTDKENLGDLVYRIKKFKAYTEPISTARKNKFTNLVLPVLFLLILVSIYFFIIKKGRAGVQVESGKQFYIYLHEFENKTAEPDLSQKFNYLLGQALNQFDRFKAIDSEAIPAHSRNNKIEENLMQLKEKFDIAYELKGRISKDKGFYVIDADLVSFEKQDDKGGNVQIMEKPITGTGQGLDSLLTIQVDMVVDRVYSILFANQGETREIKKMSAIYGSDWQKFSEIYRGHYYLKKLETAKAEKHLLQGADTPAAQYFLAQVYDFRGDRAKAMTEITYAVQRSDDLTKPLRLKVFALQARLRFAFQEEIKNLAALVESFPFSKEVFFDMGEAYFQHRCPLQAIPYYEKTLALDNYDSRAINHLAYCHSFTGNHDRAIQLFEEYNNLDMTANSFDSLGDGYFYKGDLVYAEQFKQNAVRMDENSVPYSYTTLADIYIMKAEYEKAKIALDNYYRVKNDPDAAARIYAGRAFIYYENREYEKALPAIEHSLELVDSADIKNESGEAHWLKGLILVASNKLAESKKELEWLAAFKNKYRLSPDNFSQSYKYLLHLQALLQEQEAKLDEAQNTFKALLAMKEKLSFWTYFNYQFFHSEYAKFLCRKKSHEQALAEIETCLKFNQNYIPALWIKTEICEKMKNKDAANKIYKKIKELYGASTEKNFLRNRLHLEIKY